MFSVKIDDEKWFASRATLKAKVVFEARLGAI